MALSDGLLKFLPFKRKPPTGGSSYTPSYDPASPNTPISVPTNRDHLTDIFNSRQSDDSRELMRFLFKNDPDVSAALNAFLTVADTQPWWVVYDRDGNIDREGHKALGIILTSLFSRLDYSQPAPFVLKPTMGELFSEMRHMLLLRGAIANEVVVDKTLLPTSIRQVDASTLEFTESTPGVYKVEQVVSSTRIPLDIPSFFVNYFRRDPTTLYSSSFFVSSINTISARQQVINDLYRIMTKNGYPRVAVKVIEEVLKKSAPANIASDQNALKTWITARMNEIATQVTSLRVDQTLIHTDSVQPYIVNEKNPGAQMDISNVIDVLNDSNQAALKVMSTVIGRGEKGVNTASVEARLFALNAEQLNAPISAFMSQALTFALRLHGIEALVEFGFERVEMRPDLELEPQKMARQQRYMELLSNGLISDDEFHIELFSKIRPDEIPELSGTGFYKAEQGTIDPSPNADPLGRSLSPKSGSSGKPKK